MAMNIEVYSSVFAKNDRKKFPLECLNSKPPRIKTTRVFKSSKQAPKLKKNRKTYFTIGCVIVSVGAHALGKDVAYNADDRAGPHAPH